MAQRRVLRQIYAILEGNGLKWSEDEGASVLRFDSAVVRVEVAEWGAQTLIQLRANVLQAIPEGKAEALYSEVNQLNCDTLFGKWVYYAEEKVISLEYDLLADHLQEAELMTALTAVARMADHHDDALQFRFGGRKAFEAVRDA